MRYLLRCPSIPQMPDSKKRSPNLMAVLRVERVYCPERGRQAPSCALADDCQKLLQVFATDMMTLVYCVTPGVFSAW